MTLHNTAPLRCFDMRTFKILVILLIKTTSNRILTITGEER